MSAHSSDNEELEVVDVNNSEPGSSTVNEALSESNTSSKCKYTKKRKVDEVDF
jgi:hypothetical protein